MDLMNTFRCHIKSILLSSSTVGLQAVFVYFGQCILLFNNLYIKQNSNLILSVFKNSKCRLLN